MTYEYDSHDGDLKLCVYNDADYAGDNDTRRSTSGFEFLYGGSAVNWRSVRQNLVALPTNEPEYIAAFNSIKELIWLKRLVDELSGSPNQPIFAMDNQSTFVFTSFVKNLGL